jgi:hypothetical protein
LSAQFIQGIEVCEVCIVEGLYIQAAALLKQEVESIEALYEYSQGTRKRGKTPRVSGRLKGFGRTYGELNDLAHVSKNDILQSVLHYESSKYSGPSISPVYNSELTKKFYATHIYLIVELSRANSLLFDEVFSESLNEEEMSLIFGALKILIEGGHFKPVKSDD